MGWINEAANNSVKQTLIKCLVWLKMTYIKWFLWKPLIKQTHNPQQVQDQLLLEILHHNRNSQFGKQYQFDQIKNYAQYRAKIPVCDYEALRPYIEHLTPDHGLLPHSERPVMFAQTSGTTGKPKNIPIFKHTIKQYQQSQHLVAYLIYRSIANAYSGKILAITSPAVEGVLDTGVSYGAMSGLIYQSMPAVMKSKYILPAEVLDIKDYEAKYYEITKLALAEKKYLHDRHRKPIHFDQN